MKKIKFIISALIVIFLIGCATINNLKPYCQGETAKFLRSNIDPDKIEIENISTEHYAGKKTWHFWTAITPNGSRYRCQAFTGDKTCYCTKRKIEDLEKKSFQKSRKMTS
jgi:hypothetical protein